MTPPLLCALVALGTGSAVVAPPLAAAGWVSAALVRIDATTRFGALARTFDRSVRLVSHHGYDGQFYWGIAVDPLARGDLPAAFDKASYRYGHPLYGWFAWLLSGGRADRAAGALLVLGLVSLALAAAGAALLARRHGHSPWLGLAVAANPGLLAAVRLDLAEPLAAALVVWALLAHACRRRRATWVLLALLPLVKEPLVLVGFAVAGWELLRRRRRAAALAGTTLVPAFAWWLYLRLHLGAFFTSGATALAPPLTGWAQSLAHGRRLDGPEIAVLAALLLLFAAGAVGAARRRTPVTLAYLALSVVVVLLAGNATAAFTTALRNSALTLVLAPFALAGLSRRTQSHPPPT